MLSRVTPAGDHLDKALRHRLEQNPHVGDIRGVGLFRGVEMVADRDTKAPWPAAKRLHAKIKAAAFSRGLICYPMGGTVDGKTGDHVLLAPPFIASDEQLETAAEKLAAAIEVSLAS